MKFGKVYFFIDVFEYNVFYVKCDLVEKVQVFILSELNEIVEIFFDEYDGSYLYELSCIICVVVLVLCVCVVFYFGNYIEVEVFVGKVILEGYYFLFCVIFLNVV